MIGFDGNIQKSFVMPTPHHLIRPGFMEVEVTPGVSNLFDLSGVGSQGVIMNRRYTLVESVKIRAYDSASFDQTFEVDCMLRPDARDHIGGEAAILEFVSPSTGADAGKTGSIQILADINYNTGDMTVSSVITMDPSATLKYEFVGLSVALKFTAKGSDKGRTISHVEQEMTDITIDPNEDFIISLTTEELQDYRSIFKIDLARTLSEAIKRQILLNKDFDLAYQLKMHEPELKRNNAYFTVDLNAYNSAANDYTPNNIYDVMKAVVPYISTAISSVYKRMQMYPNFIY